MLAPSTPRPLQGPLPEALLATPGVHTLGHSREHTTPCQGSGPKAATPSDLSPTDRQQGSCHMTPPGSHQPPPSSCQPSPEAHSTAYACFMWA